MKIKIEMEITKKDVEAAIEILEEEIADNIESGTWEIKEGERREAISYLVSDAKELMKAKYRNIQ